LYEIAHEGGYNTADFASWAVWKDTDHWDALEAQIGKLIAERHMQIRCDKTPSKERWNALEVKIQKLLDGRNEWFRRIGPIPLSDPETFVAWLESEPALEKTDLSVAWQLATHSKKGRDAP
jgi:hypothetical protein